MALSGTVFIDRSNSKEAHKAFDKAAEEMRGKRQSVFIFPEGTRSYAEGPELGVFKKGAFHLAVKAGVDIVPVVAANYCGVLSVREQRFRAGVIPVTGEFEGRTLSTAYAFPTCALSKTKRQESC